MQISILSRGLGCVVVLAGSTLAATAEESGMSGLHSQVRVGNKICFSDHSHTGSSGGQATRKQAEAAAIDSYQGFTAWEYGSVWGRFSLAANKTMDCSNSGGSWSCVVEAYPCRKR